MKTRAAFAVGDPWGGSSHLYADHIFEQEYDSRSKLLGPDGKPLNYQPRQKLGFDLRKTNSDKSHSNTSKS